jgi:hypothetical protein
MWNLFKRKSPKRVSIHSLVVTGDNGLHVVEYIITANNLDDASKAVEDSFDEAVVRHRSKPDFGGELRFIVYTSAVPGRELAPELLYVQSQLEATIEDGKLATSKGRPLRVLVVQKKSAF